MIRPITAEERTMLANRHTFDTMCDCPQCKNTQRRNEAMEYLAEIDAFDDSDEYYRFDNGTFNLVIEEVEREMTQSRLAKN